MRNFYFFTSKKLTAKDCYEALSKEIKNVETNGVDHISINAKFFRSYITFSDDTLDDFFFETPEQKEEFKNKIPIKNPCVTDFETRRSVDLKRVISVIMKICPDLYIDDDGDFTASAQEYLDADFDY